MRLAARALLPGTVNLKLNENWEFCQFFVAFLEKNLPFCFDITKELQKIPGIF